MQRVHGPHLGAVLRAVSQLVKLLVKPSPALALGYVASAKVAEASLASTDDHVVSHGLQQRYEEQRVANRKRSFNKLKRLVYVVVVLALVAWVALASPLFALRMSEIRVSGSGGPTFASFGDQGDWGSRGTQPAADRRRQTSQTGG